MTFDCTTHLVDLIIIHQENYDLDGVRRSDLKGVLNINLGEILRYLYRD